METERDEKPGAHPNPDTTLPWTGDYLDGFNNKIRDGLCKSRKLLQGRRLWFDSF